MSDQCRVSLQQVATQADKGSSTFVDLGVFTEGYLAPTRTARDPKFCTDAHSDHVEGGGIHAHPLRPIPISTPVSKIPQWHCGIKPEPSFLLAETEIIGSRPRQVRVYCRTFCECIQ